MIKHLNSPISQVIICGALLIIFIMTTDPFKIPMPLLILPFILITFGVYGSTNLIFGKLGMSATRNRYISGATTGLLVLLLLLQSIRQLSIKDFIILAALLLGLTFYMRKIDL